MEMKYMGWLPSNSFNESQKPIVFMLAATVLAKAKTNPTEAPNSNRNSCYNLLSYENCLNAQRTWSK